ncbi:hypothetical protein C8Q76DRAFT_308051 [Earliella scabrosa]|nr:hypothetical protein C8Q76DRAFT_308051 [Earliella scabrosa]
MFQWYALSGVCYAYLHDVPSGNGLLDAAYFPFRLSRWFTRGWTLQELIAPRFLMFMSNDWVPLGTKASLSDVVESITGVDAAVLTFSRDIADVSVARRMSWASSRHTTRVEDEAYCLMGLFGVNMSTLYGEGRDAFRRLQEEIMKRTSDHTLFAWGGILPERDIPGKLVPDALEAANFLFAPSPAAFVGSANMVSISPEKAIKAAAEYLSVLPSGVRHAGELTITSYGVRCQLLLVRERVYHLAILACRDGSGRTIAILLRQRQSSEGSLPQYYVGASFLDEGRTPTSGVPMEPRRSRVYRLMIVNHNTRYTLRTLDQLQTSRRSPIPEGQDTLTEFYIMHRPPDVSHPWMRFYMATPRRFFIPTWIDVETQRYGFQRVPRPAETGVELVRILTFTHHHQQESFTIHLGHCGLLLWATVTITPASYNTSHVAAYNAHHGRYDKHRQEQGTQGIFLSPPTAPGKPPPIMLTPLMSFESGGHQHPPHTHVPCSTYHINTWETGSMSFGDRDRTVQLTASRWPSAESYCIEVRLKGRVYEQMLLER